MRRKKKALGQALTTQDWMLYRPYENFSTYDGYYLKLANEVFKYFNHPSNGFRNVFEREDLKAIAVLVTCHFEDFINEIGLWPALVRKHESLYGWALPFYDLKNYDPDYLNPEDFAYLIWHQLGKMARKTMDPNGAPLLQAAGYCYEFFEARIEEAPTTDFYDQWLDIQPDIDFFELKTRLQWMAFDNYLIGPEFGESMEADLAKFMEESGELLQRISNPERLVYGMENDYMLIKKSSWCGQTAPEWLAEVARCPDELRPDIRRLHPRIQGQFLYEGLDKQHYIFKFVHSGRKFKVNRASVDLDVSKFTVGWALCFFAIVNWRGDWWLSGLFIGGETATQAHIDELRMDTAKASFYAWTEEEQQQIRNTTADMEAFFRSYFGARLVMFSDEKTMAQAIQDNHKSWNKNNAKQPEPNSPPNRYRDYLQQKPTGFENIDLGGGSMAVFFQPGEGMVISSIIPKIVRLLQKNNLNNAESNELFYMFFYELTPEMASYIREHYSLKNLCFPLYPDSDLVVKHFDFFLRFYNPEDIKKEAIPKLTLLPEP